ncbi:50S ribosomal protein L25 [Clostridium sp. YIM B02515]|uniref:Large ribosomal subunit protein bL25 n=1 Tax=Clostridium rhizosphaerae TaxID=2803861 RepID=A0ABS1TFP7_9CLOT|nr:50S ribosomal protein L25 [Clostridium rhizosphaerae]MBL4938150.1 50S ribosomal protein L25 [Clostridium rhizosphaerae]
MEILNAVKREKRTSHEARKERRNGRIPGILYGKNISNMLFEIGEVELTKELSKNGEHGVVSIDIDGTEHMALIKEVQKDPISRRFMHIDLEELSNETVVTTEVPLMFSGEDNVTRNGAILQKERNKVKVQCKGGNIPKSINVDVSNLVLGDTYRIGDIEFANEISFVDDANTVIAAIIDANTNTIVKDTPEVENI